MSDDKKHDANQPNQHGTDQHEQKDGNVTLQTAAPKAAAEFTRKGVEVAIQPVEHQIARVSVEAMERMIPVLNQMLKTLPAQASAAFEKIVENGKFAGLLKHVPGIGIVAAGAGGAAEYLIATKLGEHHLDAAVNALTSTAVGVGATVTGTAALPAAAISFAACEIVREGLHMAGVGIEPSLLHQHIEARLKAFPERLKTELSVAEARIELQNQNGEQYTGIVAQFKQDYSKLVENYHGHTPFGFPATPEHYVSDRMTEAKRSLINMPGDMPSGIKRFGKGVAQGKHAEATFEDDISPTVTTPQSAQSMPTATDTAPVISATPVTLVEPVSAPFPEVSTATTEPRVAMANNNPFNDLLAGYGFEVPTTSCKASDFCKANLGNMPVQQQSVAVVQTQEVAVNGR